MKLLITALPDIAPHEQDGLNAAAWGAQDALKKKDKAGLRRAADKASDAALSAHGVEVDHAWFSVFVFWDYLHVVQLRRLAAPTNQCLGG